MPRASICNTSTHREISDLCLILPWQFAAKTRIRERCTVFNGFYRVVFLSVAALVVTACGGGGSGGTPVHALPMPPSTPAISATPTSPSAGQQISFGATSTDPQSGTLSFAWD